MHGLRSTLVELPTLEAYGEIGGNEKESPERQSSAEQIKSINENTLLGPCKGFCC